MNILLVEDDNAHADLIQRTLGRASQVNVLRAPNANRALSLLEARAVNLVVLDYSLPDRDGLDLLRDIRTKDALLPIIFLTSADSAEICAKALKGGAHDYVVKKRNYLDSLPGIVSDACASAPAPQARSDRREAIDRIVGDSAPIATLRTSIMRAAASDATVLVEGETGTGKELVARAIHAASKRAKAPFVALNCTEIAEALFESELFGHTRGAFTGAVNDRRGVIEEADHGTLLLDEIEDLPPGPQVKLLRVLQTREFKPVGSSRFRRFDVRVIAASNRDVERLVEDGRFRRDLFFRLDVLRVRVPPLRERKEDVPCLAAYFVERYNRRHGTRFGCLSAAALASMTRRAWPGNVRELENLIERTLVNSTSPVVDESVLASGAPAEETADAERARIVKALERNRWSREQTARELGMSRVTLWRRMSRYRLYS